jgi:hypothetical protein
LEIGQSGFPSFAKHVSSGENSTASYWTGTEWNNLRPELKYFWLVAFLVTVSHPTLIITIRIAVHGMAVAVAAWIYIIPVGHATTIPPQKREKNKSFSWEARL